MSTLTNLQPIESYTHPEYDASRNHLSELWFMCNSRGFSYALFDTHHKQLSLYNKFEVADFFEVSPSTFQGFLNAIDLFLNDFKTIKIIFENRNFTLIPNVLYDEDEIETYYKLKFTLTDTEHLMSNRIPDFGAQIIYAVPRFMMNALLSKFADSSIREQVKIYHHIASLLSGLYYQTFHLNKEVCYVNLGEKTFDVVLIRNSSLVFCNTFEYNNAEDVLYFVMHTYLSHHLQPEVNECLISGIHPEFKAIKELLYTYLKNLSVIQLSNLNERIADPSTIFLLQYCA